MLPKLRSSSLSCRFCRPVIFCHNHFKRHKMLQELYNTYLQNAITLIPHSMRIQWVQLIRKFLIAVVNMLHPRTKLNTIHILQSSSHLVQPIILGSSQFTLSSTPQCCKEIPPMRWGTEMHMRLQY